MAALVTLSDGRRLEGYVDTCALSARSTAGTLGNLPPVTKFLGVKFATAERWGRPIPYSTAERSGGAAKDAEQCFEFGPVPYQPAGIVERHWVDREGWLNRDFVGYDEDCLSANVFIPTTAVAQSSKKIPVMVWCYGGALNTGHAAAIRHDATELVRLSNSEGENTPVIVVTGNYRLNIFGFMNHPDLQLDNDDGVSGNYGFYDQIALLTWVKQNISAFGGDENNITAFGESAGAFSLASLVARQNIDTPLFNRVICQSGAPSTMKFKPSTTPYIGYDQLLTTYHLDDPSLTPAERIAGLRKIPAQELCDFGVKIGGGWGGTTQIGNSKALWEIEPETSLRNGQWDRNVTEFILGTNQDEGTLFSSAFNIASTAGLDMWISRFPTSSATLLRELYPIPSSSSPLSLVDHPASHLLADQIFLVPMHTMATSLARSTSPPKIRMFDFRCELPQMSGHMGMGAHHGEEIPFVFGTRTFWPEGSDEERSSEAMMRRWAALATDGSGQGRAGEEAWPEWTEENQKRIVFGPGGGECRVESKVMSQLEKERQKFWIAAIENPSLSTAL